MRKTICDTAIAYADFGWHVLPLQGVHDGRCGCARPDCNSPGKHPHARYAPHGLKDATQDGAVICGWFANGAIMNVGVATGPESDLIVLDVDGRHNGFESLKQLGALPRTATVRTGNGQHLYFRWPQNAGDIRNSAGKLGPGLDIRANGGYVVAPPSIHVCGVQYKWLLDPRAGLAELPRAILGKLMAVPKLARTAPVGAIIPIGQRDNTLTSLAGTMRRRGMSEGAILAALREENQRCEPPLPDTDLVRIARSIGNKAPAACTTRLPDADAGKRELVTVCLADVAPKPVRWFWHNRFPSGKLSVFVGHPGLGKSYVTLFMASRVSTGGYWPECCGTPNPLFEAPHGRVIILTAEDGLDDTVRPRLDRMGADCSNIIAISGVKTERQELSHVDLQHDIHLLGRIVDYTPDVKLVIIDPISAYLGHVDSHKNAEVRGVLALLSQLAERHEVAVLAISHLNKSSSSSAVTRVQGSLAFTAAPRAVWMVVKDKQDEKRRLLVPVKTNLSTDPTSMAFSIEDGAVVFEKDLLKLDCDALLAEDSAPDDGALAEAKAWLQEALADGRMQSKEVLRQAKAEGIAEKTLRRAKRGLAVRSQKEGMGRATSWYWELAKVAKVSTVLIVAFLAFFGLSVCYPKVANVPARWPPLPPLLGSGHMDGQDGQGRTYTHARTRDDGPLAAPWSVQPTQRRIHPSAP